MSSTLEKRYEAAGQSHVLQFWPHLSNSEKQSLSSQLESLDIDRVNRIYAKAISAEKDASDPNKAEIIDPLPDGTADSAPSDSSKEKEWRSVGLKAIAAGQVGVLLMAGGQGTRLGSSAPKGCYDIGLPSHKSLFQYQAERIASLQRVAARETGQSPAVVIIPWYVMTSGPTRHETETFFEKNKHFGLDPKNIIIFEQGSCNFIFPRRI